MIKIINRKKIPLGFFALFLFLLFVVGFYHSRRTYFDLNSGKIKKEYSSFGVVYFTEIYSTDFSKVLKAECLLEEKAPRWKFVSGLIQGPLQKCYECGRFGYSISQLKIFSLYLDESIIPHEERVAMAMNVITKLQNGKHEKAAKMIDQFIRRMQIAEAAENKSQPLSENAL